jgi:hypothetical protein
VPSSYAPAHPTTVVPGAPAYPTGNATVPTYPSGTGAAPGTPSGTAPGAPSTPTEFPGSAGKAGLSLLAIAGALVAYL